MIRSKEWVRGHPKLHRLVHATWCRAWGAWGSRRGVSTVGALQVPIAQLKLNFTDYQSLIDQVTVQFIDPSGAHITYNRTFDSQGFELGAPHYIYKYFWPYNNPGEITVDVGAVADLWGPRPNGSWTLQIANFDKEAKNITIGPDSFVVYSNQIWVISHAQ